MRMILPSEGVTFEDYIRNRKAKEERAEALTLAGWVAQAYIRLATTGRNRG